LLAPRPGPAYAHKEYVEWNGDGFGQFWLDTSP
jgi:hypothetical protein